MKTLDALCLAYGWQGGTLTQAVQSLPSFKPIRTVYNWGYREGCLYVTDLASANIPVNSWDSDDHYWCITSYVRGLIDGLAKSGGCNCKRCSQYNFEVLIQNQ